MDRIDELLRRIEDVEVRYAFQEDTIRQLDEVVQAQADQIEILKREVREVREQLAQNAPAEAPPEEQVPPHY